MSTAIPDEVAALIEDVAKAAGKNVGLSPTQCRVLHLMSLGRSDAEIASDLACARSTVRTHISVTLERIGLASRADLVPYMVEQVLMREFLAQLDPSTDDEWSP